MTKLPRLFVNNKFSRIIHPISVTITQNIVPLDTASMTLPIGESLPARGYVELFTPYGSAGMFRVRSPHDAYGQETTSAELEHMISEVGDYIVKEEINEMLPATTAMQRVFSHYGGSKWQLGTISALGSGQVACEAKYDRVLDDMLAILEQKPDCMMSFDFTTSPWTIKIVKKGTTVTAEGRLARNVESATVTSDDSELCTRVWYQTFNGTTGTWTHKDADTKGIYGIVEGTVRTDSKMTADEVNAMVDTYLAEHKNPRISVNIQADELSQITGESVDRFTIGKLMRLALAEYGITVEQTITSIVWEDVYNNPRNVSVNLGAEEDTVVTFLHNLDSKGGGGGGGGQAKDKQEQEWKEYYTEWQKTDEYIAGMAVHQNRQGSILEQAGLTLNSQGLLVYAQTNNGLKHQFDIINERFTSEIISSEARSTSKINQTATEISQTVTNTANGLQSQITQNAKTIKAQADEIILKANRVELDAYVKATDLTTEYFRTKIAAIATLNVQAIASTGGIASSGRISGNVISGADVMVGSTSLKNAIVSASVDDNVLTLTNANGKKVTFSKATTLSGAWSSGTYTVTASPQGETIRTGGLTVASGQVTRSGNTLYVPVYAGSTNTGYKAWINVASNMNSISLGQHSNASGSKSFTAYYLAPDGQTYVGMGQHYWYSSGSNVGSITAYY